MASSPIPPDTTVPLASYNMLKPEGAMPITQPTIGQMMVPDTRIVLPINWQGLCINILVTANATYMATVKAGATPNAAIWATVVSVITSIGGFFQATKAPIQER